MAAYKFVVEPWLRKQLSSCTWSAMEEPPFSFMPVCQCTSLQPGPPGTPNFRSLGLCDWLLSTGKDSRSKQALSPETNS